MASVASRAHVIEFEPQVRSLGNRNLVVRVKVAVTAAEAVAKLCQHSIRWRLTEAGLSKHFDDIRLPVAVYALPAVALEAEDPQPAMGSIVSTLGGRTTMLVVFTLPRSAMFFARSAVCEGGAAGRRARTRQCVRH
jgi:hypothetical protein